MKKTSSKKKQKPHKIKKKEITEIETHLTSVEKQLDAVDRSHIKITGLDRLREEVQRLKTDFQARTLPKSNKFKIGAIAFSVILFAFLFFFPIQGLTLEGRLSIAIFLFVFVLWVSEALPLPITGLIPGLLLFFFGLKKTPADAFAGYAHPAVFFIVGSLIIAQGLVQSGLSDRFANFFIAKSRNNPNILLFMMILIPTILAMFISDHLVAAMLLPVVISIVYSGKIEGKFKTALVLAVTFGAVIAGIATPSGGARNVIVLSFLENIAATNIPYLDWVVAVSPITFIMIPVVWIVLRLMFPPSSNVIIWQSKNHIEQEKTPLSKREWYALGVFGLTLLFFVTLSSNILDLGTIAIIGAILMFIVGAISWNEVEKRINWGIMFIYGAAITMGTTLRDTGATEWIAKSVIHVLPLDSPILLALIILAVGAILTDFMNNGATASLLAPITINIALLSSISPKTMALTTAIATGASFLTVFGTPSTIIMYSSGLFKPKDLFKAGAIIEVTIILLTVLIMSVYWPTLGL